MIKLKEIQPGCIYLFSGKCAASSLFIESLSEAQELIQSANDRFAGFLKIHDYLITKEGWSFVCEICGEKEIQKRYLSARNDTGRTYKREAYSAVWRIISEQVRHWLSRFIKKCNFEQRRTGGKVHSSYERRLFVGIDEAQEYIVSLHCQQHDYGQKNRKYRGNGRHFQVSKKEGVGHIYLCSKNLRVLGLLVFGEFGAVVERVIFPDVLRELVNLTFDTHFATSFSKDPKKIE